MKGIPKEQRRLQEDEEDPYMSEEHVCVCHSGGPMNMATHQAFLVNAYPA